MLRVLIGLWKPSGGKITRPLSPGRDGFLFLPQKSYVTEGSLLDNIIYPNRQKGDVEEDEVMNACIDAGLTKVVERYGLTTERTWEQILSGGELQRLNFARLFFHRPAIAFMDEATSSLDETSEGHLLTKTKARGIMLFSVAHRETLLQYHTHLHAFLHDGSDGGKVAVNLTKLQ